MLIEIHVLQNHAPSNLNRDDTGSPKECVFGGVKRARISSQCLKRSIRRSTVFRAALEGRLATRTRRLPELVRDRLLGAGLPGDVAEVAARKVSGFGARDGATPQALRTAQTMFLAEPEVAAVADAVLSAARAAGTAATLDKVSVKDLQARAQDQAFRSVTADIALFGRMVTSGAFRSVEAAAQVAHAISTHRVDHEFDYFTAVDDLTSPAAGGAGADMVGDVEFASACYYKYFSVDAGGLVRNLTGRDDLPARERAAAETLAADVVCAFLRAAITVSPSGLQHAFAAHQLPAAVLLEVRPQCTPVSYANAFVDPACSGPAGGLVEDSLAKLGRHVEALTAGFGLEASARLLLAPEHPRLSIAGTARVADLNALCTRLRDVMRGRRSGGRR
jgi:CRISPR system Cascade subunit CasC